MQRRLALCLSAVGLASMLTLTGCVSTSNSSPKSSASPAATTSPSTSKTTTGPSTTTPFSKELPFEFQPLFKGLTGHWIYQADESKSRVVALSDFYDPAMLKAFVDEKLSSGWTVLLAPQVDASGYVATITDKNKDTLVIVGLVSGVDNGAGKDTSPATVVTYEKATK